MRARWTALVVVLLVLAGCGLTLQDFSPNRPSKAARTFKSELDILLAEAIARRDAAEIAKQLDAGANPEAVGTSSTTMLQFAVDADSEPGVVALLAAKADPDKIGQFGSTAVHQAAQSGRGRLLELLLSAGADVNVRSTLGQTPLFSAVEARSPALVRQLLDAGANPKAVTKLKDTVLHAAARINAGDLILILLEAGADPRARNGSNGATFQDYYFSYDKQILNEQAKTQRQQVADWLRAHGIEVDPRA